jgi:hypothetical protein
METPTHGAHGAEDDEPAVFWLVVLGLFDAVVAAGLLVLAGRWFSVLLIATAGAVGFSVYWLAGRLTGAGVWPRLAAPSPRAGQK